MAAPQVIAILNGRGWEQYPSKLSTEIKGGDIICLFPVVAGGRRGLLHQTSAMQVERLLLDL